MKGAIKALDVVEGQSIAFNVVNGQVVLEAVKTTDDNEKVCNNKIKKWYINITNKVWEWRIEDCSMNWIITVIIFAAFLGIWFIDHF